MHFQKDSLSNFGFEHGDKSLALFMTTIEGPYIIHKQFVQLQIPIIRCPYDYMIMTMLILLICNISWVCKVSLIIYYLLIKVSNIFKTIPKMKTENEYDIKFEKR